MNSQPIHEEYEPARPSFWTRIRNGLLGPDEPEEDEIDEPNSSSPEGHNTRTNTAPLRLSTARANHVVIRLNAQVFEDAKMAADGLKNGEQQIVNLERATPQMGERIIDFLNGVCYALDGTVERVGEKVYMFVPANVAVEVDNGAMSSNTTVSNVPPPRRSTAYPDNRE